jgi:hypothetical protein
MSLNALSDHPGQPRPFLGVGLLNADYREDLIRMFIKPLAEIEQQELVAARRDGS